eukprot:gene32544-17261_t
MADSRLDVLANQFTLGLDFNHTSAGLLALDPDAFTVSLPEKLTSDGPWDVRRSALSPYKLVSSYPAPDDHIRTLHDNLEVSIGRFPHMPFLGSRKRDEKGNLGNYQWMTYSQVGDARTSIGSGLLELGVRPGSAMGIYSTNCREWVLVDGAMSAYSVVSVPLYDTLGPDSVEYISNHAELSAVACSAAMLPTMMQCLPQCPSVKLVVVYGQSGRLPEAPPGSQAKIISLDQVESLGRRHPKAHVAPKPSDIATICYTSGTTGAPKGAMLTHSNLIASSAGASIVADLGQAGWKYISYLPLAHIYERVNLISMAHLGNAVGFFSGDVQELLDDVLTLQPDIFPSVPRLWNRIYDRVMGTIRSGSTVTRMMFERAYAYKKACLAKGDPVGGRWGMFYDKLIFSKIKAKVGGNVKVLITGASPISDEVITFMRIAFGATVLEGYGMTESASAMSVTCMNDLTTGHVGPPLPCGEIKLEDIPEMGYLNADEPHARGEICVRGPTVFAGYFKDEVQTRECLDEDGWLHTGDVGMWLPRGQLKIIDRKKNLFKLAQGEYIAPEKIEGVVSRSPLVQQVFVFGDSLRAQLVALAIPDPEVLLPWAKERGLSANVEDLCKDPEVITAVLKSMQEEGRVAKLRGFEQIAAVHLIPEPFSVENGMMTPTFKIKRPQIRNKYQDCIDAMYAALPTTQNGGPGQSIL